MTSDPDIVGKPASGGAARSPRAEALLGSAPDEQIAAAVAAEKWARAADLLELHGERLLLDGGVRELSGWLEALPDEHVTRNPKVAVLFAWVRIYDQRYQDALKCLSKAERALQQARLAEHPARDSGADALELHPHAELEQSLAALRLHLRAVTGADPKAVKGASLRETFEQALPSQVEEIMLPASGDHPIWRAGALVILGRSRLVAGDLRGAADDLEAAHLLASSSRGPRAALVKADAAVMLGRVAEARGQLAAAEKRYAEVLGARDLAPAPRLAAEVGQARLALWRLDLDAARRHLAALKGRPDAEGGKLVDLIRVVLEGALAQAQLQLFEGRAEEARLTLEQLERALIGAQVRWPLEHLAAVKARAALVKRDESQARRWLQQTQMRAAPSQTPRSPIGAYEGVTAALVHAGLHAPDPAAQAARDALAFAEESGHELLLCEAQLALALAHYGAGSRGDARAALIAALEGVRATGALAALCVRGVDRVAEELGVSGEEITRAAALLPAITPTQRDRNERPASRPRTVSGPIETTKVAEVETNAAPAEVSAPASPDEPDPAEAEPASPGGAGRAG